MRTHVKRSTAPPRLALGIRKNIPVTRSRQDEEDLRVFREMSKISRRIASEYIDRLLGRA